MTKKKKKTRQTTLDEFGFEFTEPKGKSKQKTLKDYGIVIEGEEE